MVADFETSDFFPNPYAVDGIDRGALVHFSEDNARDNDTSTTPWIAFISCDRCVRLPIYGARACPLAMDHASRSEPNPVLDLRADTGSPSALTHVAT